MPPTMTITTTDPDTEEETETKLPAKWEICHRCEGEGHHSNPSIDGNGITSEEWNGPDWDEESRETYLSGGYDIPCTGDGCQGGKVLVPDPDSMNAAQKATVERWEEERNERARWDAEDRHTRRMESGGYDY